VRTSYAIEVDGEAVGGIGLAIGADVHRLGAEIGYWLGEAVWGRGIATAVVRTLTPWAFATFGLERIFAGVFSSNPASMRVLEKCGYVREGVLRRAVIKDGRMLDQVLYAVTRVR
jgi:ribosomal-protein-alanine N-acetyltransferase